MDPVILLSKYLNRPIVITEYKENKFILKDIKWTNNDKYNIIIDEYSIAINQEKGLYAWLEYHEKMTESNGVDCQYYLKMADKNSIFFEWIPETYNPFFGCDTFLLKWYDEKLLFIYREKHDFYACKIENKKVVLQNLNCHDVAIYKDKMGLLNYENENLIQILSLPNLDKLPSITKEEAKKANLYFFTQGD